MGRVVDEAKADAALSGIECQFMLSQLSYLEFLQLFDTDRVDPEGNFLLVEPEPELEPEPEPEPVPAPGAAGHGVTPVPGGHAANAT